MPSYSRMWRFWLPVVIWLAVIAFESFGLSSNVTGGWLKTTFRAMHISLSDQVIALLDHVLRKTGHFIGYGVLTLLLFRGFFYTLSLRGPMARFFLRCAVLALGITLLVAVLDEWHQSFDISRTGTPRDVALDMSGGVTAQLIAFTMFTAWRRGRVDMSPS